MPKGDLITTVTGPGIVITDGITDTAITHTGKVIGTVTEIDTGLTNTVGAITDDTVIHSNALQTTAARAGADIRMATDTDVKGDRVENKGQEQTLVSGMKTCDINLFA